MIFRFDRDADVLFGLIAVTAVLGVLMLGYGLAVLWRWRTRHRPTIKIQVKD